MPVTVQGTVVQEVTLNTGLVYLHPDPLKFNINPFKYDIGGKRSTYAGVLGQSVTDDDTNYVYLDSDGTLVVNITGFPSDGILYLPLARVVATNGEIVSIIDERILVATSVGSEGTCRIGYPVDGDVKGGDTAASSNNDWAAVRYDASGSEGEGRNRWVRRPPQNYLSGDIVLRLYCSVATTVGTNKSTRWNLSYKFASVGESLGTMTTVSTTEDVSDQPADELFTLDLTIPEAAVNISKDLMALYLARDYDHADDDCPENIYVHQQELRYTGRLVAGQAGQ